MIYSAKHFIAELFLGIFMLGKVVVKHSKKEKKKKVLALTKQQKKSTRQYKILVLGGYLHT